MSEGAVSQRPAGEEAVSEGAVSQRPASQEAVGEGAARERRRTSGGERKPTGVGPAGELR